MDQEHEHSYSRSLTIGSRTISDASPAYVIAEIGHNHQGSLDTCMALFRAAKEAGASAVKLQKRDNRALFTPDAFDRPYDNENSYGATYGQHREALEFGAKEYRFLDRFAAELGLDFFATPFDIPSADFLAENIRCPAFKISSADLVNQRLLMHVAGFKRPVILSTGGGVSIKEVQSAAYCVTCVHTHLAILQCTATYPAQPEHLNLRVIETYRQRWPELVVGLSSHVSGIWDGPPAYVLGARIFEKHFTLNRAMKGTDHAFSLEPAGLKKFIRDLERTRLALGDGVKVQLPEERPAMEKMRTSTRWWAEMHWKDKAA